MPDMLAGTLVNDSWHSQTRPWIILCVEALIHVQSAPRARAIGPPYSRAIGPLSHRAIGPPITCS